MRRWNSSVKHDIFLYDMSLEYMETDMAHFTLDQIWHDVNCWDAGSCKYMNTELETANAFFSSRKLHYYIL